MKLRCLSCRKLKIGCDRRLPKCEYCESTGRECIYLQTKRKKKSDVKVIINGNTIGNERRNGAEVNAKRLPLPGTKVTADSPFLSTNSQYSVSPNTALDNDIESIFNPSIDEFPQFENPFEYSDLLDPHSIRSSVGSNVGSSIGSSFESSFGSSLVSSLEPSRNPSPIPKDSLDPALMEDFIDLELQSTSTDSELTEDEITTIIRSDPILYYFYNNQFQDTHDINEVFDLNQGHIHLGISKFEYHLLIEFPKIYIGRDRYDLPLDQLNPIDQVWITEAPSLWHKSSILKNNIFSLAALFLHEQVDIGTMLVSDLGPTGEYRGLKYNTQDSQEEGYTMFKAKSDLSSELHERTLSYFEKSIRETNQAFNQLLSQGENYYLDLDQAAELALSSLLLFSFLGLQNFHLIKLVNFNDPLETDLIRLIKSMKLVIGKALPLLYNTRFHGFFYITELLTPNLVPDENPISTHLIDDFHQNFHDTGFYDDATYKKLSKDLHVLQISLHRAIKESSFTLIYRWIFFFNLTTYDLIEQGDNFALKMLFFYTFLIGVTGFGTSDNCFRDYVTWYKTHQKLDQYDKAMVKLYESGYHIKNAAELRTFDAIAAIESQPLMTKLR